MHDNKEWECSTDLCLGRLGHVQGEEVCLRKCLLPADQLHPQGCCLDLRCVRVICYHFLKAQANASSGNLAAYLQIT